MLLQKIQSLYLWRKRMSEKSFWALIRKKLPLKMYRVENKVMKGMPDIHYIKDGQSGWIELKYIDKWPKKRIAIGFKLNQSLWAKEYTAKGGRSWILIRAERTHIILIKGEKADVLYKRPHVKDLISMARWSKNKNMTDKDWDELASILTIP